MSCFEQSTFLQNVGSLDQKLLIQACSTLQWKSELRGAELWVYPPAHLQAHFLGEPALRVLGNTIVWNSYFQKDGAQKADALREAYTEAYHVMRVQYAREAILTAFHAIGFTQLEDFQFQPNETEKHRFFMKGRSKIQGETEPTASIQFTILADGTVRTSSDYIPEDIHLLADQAMASLEQAFGNVRSISPKDIPAKYRSKAFCHRQDVIQLRQGKV
jgi:hypothetical protein